MDSLCLSQTNRFVGLANQESRLAPNQEDSSYKRYYSSHGQLCRDDNEEDEHMIWTSKGTQ